jgi:GNAT superfamily N-acetyltransferase
VSLDPVPAGYLAAVVTYLEMLEPPASLPPPSPLSLWKLEPPDLNEYRHLFRLVGARWLWFSRLALDDAELGAIVKHPKVELFAVVSDDAGEAGLLELDFRVAGECELAFVGLVPELTGQGHGRWLLAEALRLAWRDGITRVHVHTCTLDHPAALGAYRRAGFTPIKRAVETFPDPRLSGLLPPDCAPHWPSI